MSSEHVVMVVASGIASDARVRKTAVAVADLGYRVTLLYGELDATEPVEGTLGPARTVGLPVAYTRRDEQVERRRARRAWRPSWPAYRDGEREEHGRQALNTRRASKGDTPEILARRGIHWARRTLRAAQDPAFRLAWGKYDGLRARFVGRTWRSELPNIVDLERVFTDRMAAETPDILHVHDIHLLSAGVRVKQRAARTGRAVRLIYDAHEYIPGTVARTVLEENALKAMESDLIGDADAVITVSEPIAEALRDRYDLRRTPSVVLNSPSLTVESTCAKDVRTESGIEPGTPLVVYSGVLNEKRGLPTVVQALSLLPEVHFAVVCVPDASHWRAALLMKAARKAGVSDRVHLIDPVAPEEILAYLRTADVGIHPLIAGLPNHEMALPNKLFDYLFAGLPIVVSDLKLMGAFVRENRIGTTFTASDHRDCARAIREALENVKVYGGSARSEEFTARFSWEHQIEQLDQTYAAL
ncbi:glycosyltransferase [Occultella glacieicola]|uniref:Glycosyltransferase n=1 Tax=Occultella glacieicola TaxID=2518684 RepID=A0ABY2E800_9MICO|nr:glycosyltransferase [Occultella glacieicola]TDE96144.1 glycosyltransferase [Occultella glacieicola]